MGIPGGHQGTFGTQDETDTSHQTVAAGTYRLVADSQDNTGVVAADCLGKVLDSPHIQVLSVPH